MFKYHFCNLLKNNMRYIILNFCFHPKYQYEIIDILMNFFLEICTTLLHTP